MDKKQALDLIKQVVEAYRGTAKEHRLLAQALEVLSKDIKQKDK